MEIWDIYVPDKGLKSVGKRQDKLDRNLKKGFAIVIYRCSDTVKARLETGDKWKNINANQDLHDQSTQSGGFVLCTTTCIIWCFNQEDNVSTEHCLEDFKFYWEIC